MQKCSNCAMLTESMEVEEQTDLVDKINHALRYNQPMILLIGADETKSDHVEMHRLIYGCNELTTEMLAKAVKNDPDFKNLLRDAVQLIKEDRI